MNRSMFSGRYLLLAAIVIIIFSRFLGLWEWKAREYVCLNNESWQLGKKVQTFNWGSLHLYLYPIVRDCPEFDREDPEELKNLRPYSPAIDDHNSDTTAP
jgi:hypothetical protein